MADYLIIYFHYYLSLDLLFVCVNKSFILIEILEGTIDKDCNLFDLFNIVYDLSFLNAINAIL